MGALGISLIVASVGLLWFRREQWLPYFLGLWRQTPRLGPPSVRPAVKKGQTTEEKKDSRIKDHEKKPGVGTEEKGKEVGNRTNGLMPPPPPRIANPPSTLDSPETTPKASATTRDDAIPTFTLSDEDNTPAPPKPSSMPPPPLPRSSNPSFMLPPPRPSTLSSSTAPRPSTLAPRPPTLAPITSNIPRPRPIPSRPSQPRQSGSSTLAPPPSHASTPTKPSRSVVLTPGHSPLDWARLSSSPHVDLRNLPGGPSAPYLRVTPSLLKKMTGRKGKDAWSAMGGKVYNITPYLPFHPGGEAELLRGAARDGTRLFGEVHPWVNYENMLASCLIGIMVSESEGREEGKMDEMD